ncbi:MAG: nuclear transport factor 2 family protein [Pseudomonadota bacterium]
MEAEAFVRELNAAWRERRWDDLAQCFDEQVVMLLPFGDETLEGREAMLASYREFVDTAQHIELYIDHMDVRDFGSSAIVHMSFRIEYAIDGEHESTDGLEVYALHADPGRAPRVIWRTQRLHGEPPVITLES